MEGVHLKYRSIEEWTFEDALSELENFNEKRDGARKNPVLVFMAFRDLDACQSNYQTSNSGREILRGVKICAANDIVLPDWLADAFCNRYYEVVNCSVDSWDKAFGKPFPKGKHLNAMRKERNLSIRVYNEIRNILLAVPDTPIDKSLFERVGAQFGLGATLAEEYYYSRLKQFPKEKSR